jgi:hypothetical protein
MAHFGSQPLRGPRSPSLASPALRSRHVAPPGHPGRGAAWSPAAVRCLQALVPWCLTAARPGVCTSKPTCLGAHPLRPRPPSPAGPFPAPPAPLSPWCTPRPVGRGAPWSPAAVSHLQAHVPWCCTAARMGQGTSKPTCLGALLRFGPPAPRLLLVAWAIGVVLPAPWLASLRSAALHPLPGVLGRSALALYILLLLPLLLLARCHGGSAAAAVLCLSKLYICIVVLFVARGGPRELFRMVVKAFASLLLDRGPTGLAPCAVPTGGFIAPSSLFYGWSPWSSVSSQPPSPLGLAVFIFFRLRPSVNKLLLRKKKKRGL